MLRRCALFSLLSLPLTGAALAQLPPSAAWAALIGNQYRLSPNVTYHTADGVELEMDVYSRRDTDTPQPTLVYLHGGFWVAGAREGAIFALIPWLERGWNVVNVEYRLGPAHLAPAAVEDAFCALRFAAAEAQRFNVDPERIVVTGESAGGHLALVLGMIPDGAGLADSCPGETTPRVAAVVNWFGVTDVPDVIQGPNRQEAAARWFGDMPQATALEIARRVSPLGYVRADLPPILTIHGDADNVVPYDEGVRLHAALDEAGVPNQLLTIPGAGHGRFPDDQRVRAFATIWEFLEEHGAGGR
jgi:acetyl esterase/lipase